MSNTTEQGCLCDESWRRVNWRSPTLPTCENTRFDPLQAARLRSANSPRLAPSRSPNVRATALQVQGMAEAGGKPKSKGFLSRASRARPEWSRRSLASGSATPPIPSPAATAPSATTSILNQSSASLDSSSHRPTESLLPRSTYSANISNQPSSAVHLHSAAHHSASSYLAPAASTSNGVSEGSLAATLVKRVVARVSWPARARAKQR